jgi:hypothetical protein
VGALASRASRHRLLRVIKERFAAELRGARTARPVSEIAFELARTLERSRELVERQVAHG